MPTYKHTETGKEVQAAEGSFRHHLLHESRDWRKLRDRRPAQPDPTPDQQPDQRPDEEVVVDAIDGADQDQ